MAVQAARLAGPTVLARACQAMSSEQLSCGAGMQVLSRAVWRAERSELAVDKKLGYTGKKEKRETEKASKVYSFSFLFSVFYLYF
jgi:hypothetical protein